MKSRSSIAIPEAYTGAKSVYVDRVMQKAIK
jgi:hypothetical protein